MARKPRKARPSGAMGKRISRGAPDGGVPDLFAKIEQLARDYGTDVFVEEIKQRAVMAGDSISDIPPEFLNKYFWLSIRLANDYIEGCRVETPKGLGGRPSTWPAWRLSMLAWAVDAVKQADAERGHTCNDADACRFLRGHTAWPEASWQTLRRRLQDARKLR